MCFVTGEYPPAIGGIADYTALLAEHLRRTGIRVTILTSARGPAGAGEAVTVRGWGPGSLGEIAGRVADIDPDIVHLQYQTAAFGMSPAVCLLPFATRAVPRRPRFVTTFHDLRVPYLFPRAGGLRRAPARVLLGAGDHSIFTSQADLLEARPRRGASWIPIGPGVIPRSRASRAASRDRFHIDGDAFTIAYFGLVNTSKGVETLFGAAERLRRTGIDFKLLLIGEDQGVSDPTNAATAARAHDLASQLGLEDGIIRTGWLPPSEISDALKAADVAALPYADGASLRRSTLITCFAHGVPVVTTTPAVQVEIPARFAVEPFDQVDQFRIDGRVAALVPPGDDAALGEEITSLFRDDGRRERLARAGRRFAKRLSWPDIATATARVYGRTLEPAA